MEFFNLLIESFFWALLFWFGLQILRSNLAEQQKTQQQREQQALDTVQKIYRQVKVEQYQDMFYLYDAATDEFIAQGRNTEDFAQRLGSVVVVHVVGGEADAVAGFKKIIPQDRLG